MGEVNMVSVITVTKPADEHVSRILESNPGMVLMVGYDNKGCSGHKYTFDLISESQIGHADDVVKLTSGAIVVPARFLMGLLGSTLDLVGDQFDKRLEWHNPLAINKCGCGDSFQLSDERACKG